jgi:hypothetical protein
MTGLRVLWAATAAAYAFVVLGPGAVLIGTGGGAQPFDLRFAGYTLAEAQGYLGLIGAAGRMQYLSAVIPADMIFATLFAVTMAASALRAGAGVAVAALCALPGLCDLAENLTLAQMLAQAGAGLDPRVVARASVLTQAKWAALVLAALLLARALWRRR